MVAPLLQWFHFRAARIRFNETQAIAVNGTSYWAKRRRPSAFLLVRAANLYARSIGLPLRMLSERQWLDYEPRVFQELLSCGSPLRQGRRLCLPHAPGENLTRLLTDATQEQQQRAVALATAELFRLHQQSIRHPWAGEPLSFSHGDATPTNVMVDLHRGEARWVDYETVHPPNLPPAQRHADDLRTLMCGIADLVPAETLPNITATLFAAYPNREALTSLQTVFQHWQGRPSLRQLAMPPAGECQWRSLVAAVRCALPSGCD